MNIFDRMLLDNKAWAAEMTELTPTYFKRLSQVQSPQVLWLGCSDSRVPSEIVVNADPGEVFVHRNIANQLLAEDFNATSVLQYAVDVLQVSHIVVCGHYNCGGILAAMAPPNPELTIVNQWLKSIRETYASHEADLALIKDADQRCRRFVELNVIQQVRHLAQSPIVQATWERYQRPMLHGCVYGIEDGLIKEIQRTTPEGVLHAI
jgi:carbonic anhydrase